MLLISAFGWQKNKKNFVVTTFLWKGRIVARCIVEKKIVENA